MKKLFWNIVKWMLYSGGFMIITLPLTIYFNLGIWEKISLSLLLGFFAGLLNEISSTLHSINNQLRGRF